MERKYLPTLSELIDKLSIVTLKSIKLKHKKEYEKEAKELMYDINLILKDKIKDVKDYGIFVRAIQVGMLANELIWANETKAREGGRTQDYLLPFTHSVNSIRMRAGNVIAYQLKERKDLNLDRLVSDVCKKRGYDFEGLFDEPQ